MTIEFILIRRSFDTISCIRDSARISFLNNDIKSVKVTGNNFISESKNTFVYQPGFYDYIIINNKKYPSSGRLQIVRNDTIPVVQAVSGSIKCNQDSVFDAGFVIHYWYSI